MGSFLPRTRRWPYGGEPVNTRIADGQELQPTPPKAAMSDMGQKQTSRRPQLMSASCH